MTCKRYVRTLVNVCLPSFNELTLYQSFYGILYFLSRLVGLLHNKGNIYEVAVFCFLVLCDDFKNAVLKR